MSTVVEQLCGRRSKGADMRGRCVMVSLALFLSVTGCTASKGAGSPAVTILPSKDPNVVAANYDYGVDAVHTEVVDSELSAVMYRPKVMTGRHRVVLLQHGSHNPCLKPDMAWPCATPQDRIPSCQGYEQLASVLVRQGYVVLSVAANGIIGKIATEVEGVLLNRHLHLLEEWNDSAAGPFGDALTGHLDLESIGLVGHSRGGEAVARYAAGQAGEAPSARVAGTVLLAPVMPALVDSPAWKVPGPMAALIGTCDSDGRDDGVHYVDVAPGSSLVTVHGTNHNGYNSVWSPTTGRADTHDDADYLKPPKPECETGTPYRLTETRQTDVAGDVMAGFFHAAFSGTSTDAAVRQKATAYPKVVVVQ